VQVELAAVLSIFAAACVVNQISHLLLNGSLFTWLRHWATNPGREGPFAAYTRGLFGCRLCFAQEVAAVVTWATLALAYSVDPCMTPWQGWLGAAVFGPFAVGGVDWLLNACREREVDV
jgi:hypothetical protein